MLFVLFVFIFFSTFSKLFCATDRFHIYLQSNGFLFNEIMRRDIFQAIADPTRRAILSLIMTQAMTPNALAEHFDSTRQAVSKHLKILSECSVIRQELSGREIYYHFNPIAMKEVADYIEPFKKLWQDRFDQLDDVLTHL